MVQLGRVDGAHISQLIVARHVVQNEWPALHLFVETQFLVQLISVSLEELLNALLQIADALLVLEEFTALADGKQAVERRAQHLELAVEASMSLKLPHYSAHDERRLSHVQQVVLTVLVAQLVDDLAVFDLHETLVAGKQATLVVDLSVLVAVAHRALVLALESPHHICIGVEPALFWVRVEVRPLVEDELRMIDDATNCELVLQAICCATDAVLVLRLVDGLEHPVVAELLPEEQVVTQLIALVVDDLLDSLVFQLITEGSKLVTLQLFLIRPRESHVNLDALLDVDDRPLLHPELQLVIDFLLLIVLHKVWVDHLNTLPTDVIQIQIPNVQHLNKVAHAASNAIVVQVDGHQQLRLTHGVREVGQLFLRKVHATEVDMIKQLALANERLQVVVDGDAEFKIVALLIHKFQLIVA